MTVHTIILECLDLKAQITEHQSRLKVLQAQLAGLAVFSEGKHTATIQGDGVLAKVVNKMENSWDQPKLNAARAQLGDETFLSLFGFEWKPRAKKDIDGFLAHAPQDKRQPILDALTIKTSQSVSFERVE